MCLQNFTCSQGPRQSGPNVGFPQARILCVVARDHMLPPALARISPRLGTPVPAATVMGLATGGTLPTCERWKP